MNPENTRTHAAGYLLRPQARRTARTRESQPRTVCQVLPLKDEQGFAVALVRLLDRSIPEVHFQLSAAEQPDWLWICGFEPCDFERVARLRSELEPGGGVARGRPRLLVTGRSLAPIWRDELVRAGVDLVLEWPLPVDELRARLVRGA
jgi:hypothetical protein